MINEVFKSLTSIRKLRVISKDVNISVLEDSLVKLTRVVQERRQEIEVREREHIEREANLKEIAKKITDMGVDVDLLASFLESESAQKQKKPKRPPKYEYTDYDGSIKSWTGQGRMPSVIQTSVDQGTPLDFFAINS
jgi:DNA-binding protein H-NS